jgi:hypothetical protein
MNQNREAVTRSLVRRMLAFIGAAIVIYLVLQLEPSSGSDTLKWALTGFNLLLLVILLVLGLRTVRSAFKWDKIKKAGPPAPK